MRDVSFAAQDSECVGILGNNGAGKSTLITCINRIRIPEAGEVLIDGKSVQSMSRNEMARTIAYVAQKNEMMQATVFDCVLLGRKPYIKWGVSQEDLDLCAAMIQRVGLEEFQVRQMDELSGGELQRYSVLRSLNPKTKFLIADEMTTMLDAVTQVQILDSVIKIIKKRKMGLLIVSHDLDLIDTICDDKIYLKDINNI